MTDRYKININYSDGGVEVTLSIKTDDNLPYNLAEAFTQVIKDSSANPEIIIKQLQNEFPDIEML